MNIIQFTTSAEITAPASETHASLRIERTENPPAVKIWRGKAFRPFANYYFRTAERREVFIAEAKRNEDARQAAKVARSAVRKAFQHSLNIGDILYSVWGYEQTNADFYQVTDLRGKTCVVIRKIAAPLLNGEEGFMSGRRVATKDAFIGETELKRVREGNVVTLNSYKSASPWDGRPVGVSWYA